MSVVARITSLPTRPNGARRKDEHLPSFDAIHKREKDLIDVNGQYPGYAMAPGKIPTEPGEDDSVWLMSPFAEPDMEPNEEMLREKPFQHLTRFAGNIVASKAGAQRSISPNWKTKVPPRYSSTNGRPPVSLAEKKHIKTEPTPRQKMHQSSAGLDVKIPQKVSMKDIPVEDKMRHLRKNMLDSNFSRSNGKDSSVKAEKSTGNEYFARSTIPPENPKSKDQASLNLRTVRSISASRSRSNTQVPSLNMEQELTNQLSQVPSSKVVSRDSIKESNPFLSTTALESFKPLDHRPSHMRTGRSHSVSRVHSNAHITSFNGKPEPTTQRTQVPSSWSATRDHKQESKQNVPVPPPKNSEFSHQAPVDMGTGRSHSVSRVYSTAQIPFTSKPQPRIQYSQISSSTRVSRDGKQENNLNASTIPTKNHKFLGANPSESRPSRSQSVSRVHSSTHNYSGANKLDPIIQHCRISSSSGLTKDQKHENNQNASTIPPPNPKTGRSVSVSRVHSSSQIPLSSSKPEPIIQSSRVSSSSGITKDQKHGRHAIAGSTQKENSEHGSRAHVVGSNMVDKLLKARMSNAEERQFKSQRDTLTKEISDERRPRIEGRQSKTGFNNSIYDSSSFSRSISKFSLDMALKHTELRRVSSIPTVNSIIAGRRSVSVSKS